MTTILVTGSNGQLGNEIRCLSGQYPDYNFIYTDVEELNITDYQQIDQFFKNNNIRFIINCAAYTSVDKAEQDKQWKDMAVFYNLEGYHFRTNENFETDLRRVYNQNGLVTIPWYILINENGDIINKNASRPSEIHNLEKDINNN